MVTEVDAMSRTRALADWFAAEIRRVEGDISILESAFQYGSESTRYCGLLSNELLMKMADDRRKFEQMSERARFLHAASELKIDVDAMERAIPGLLVSVQEGSSFGFPRIIGEMQVPCPYFTGFAMWCCDPLQLDITIVSQPLFGSEFSFENLQSVESSDFSRVPSTGYFSGSIMWHFLSQYVIIRAQSPPGSKDVEIKLRIMPIQVPT
jgi:hypothetical protein